MVKATDVDHYIAAAAPGAQAVANKIRDIIKSTIPGIEEGISWGVPFYKYHGALAGFAVYKKHVSFGGTGLLEKQHRELLEQKGYKTGNKTFQVQFDQEVPATIIKKILNGQAKLNKAKSE